MDRVELERLSKEELIELVLRLQRPEKTSRTSSKPPSTDRKEPREKSKPGGAKPGHEGHSRVMSEAPGVPETSEAAQTGRLMCRKPRSECLIQRPVGSGRTPRGLWCEAQRI